MTPRDYRESWAWVHFLLSGPPEDRDRLRAYLAKVGRSEAEPPPSLAAEIDGRLTGSATLLLSHLKDLGQAPLARSTKPAAVLASEPTVRLQGASVETLVKGSKNRPRKGMFGKMRDFFFGPAEVLE